MSTGSYFWEPAICYWYEWPSSLYKCLTWGANSFMISVESSLGEILDTLPCYNALLLKITPCHPSVSSHPKIFTKTSGSNGSDLLSSCWVPGAVLNTFCICLIERRGRVLRAALVLKVLWQHQDNLRATPWHHFYHLPGDRRGNSLSTTTSERLRWSWHQDVTPKSFTQYVFIQR